MTKERTTRRTLIQYYLRINHFARLAHTKGLSLMTIRAMVRAEGV